MAKRIAFADLPRQLPTGRVLTALLGDQAWFSVVVLRATAANEAGLTWKETLRGLISVDDWGELEAVSESTLESLSGSVHSPDARWELPFSANTDEILLPDTTTDGQIRAVRDRLSSIVSSTR